MNARDARSVGELLLESELIARSVLMDTDDLNGRAMVRTWGELVQSAGDLWEALPRTERRAPGGAARRRHAGVGDDAVMDQLQGISRGVLHTRRGHPWPGDGPAEGRLLQISANLITASELVTARRDDVHPMRPAVRADLSAAKARLVHTLYVASHGVNVSLGRDIRAFEGVLAKKEVLPQGESLAASRIARERVAVFEQLAGSYVSRTYPDALRGEHRPPPSGSRLGQALACLDVQVHRTLVRDPSGAGLLVTAQSRSLIMMAGQALLDAAAQTGVIEPDQYRSRLAPALEEAQTAWAGMATTWRDLTPPSARRLTPDFTTAAAEARAAILEIIHHRATLATPQVLAERVDLASTARTIQDAISAGLDQAHLIHQVTSEPGLTGSARAVNAMAIASGNPWGGHGASEHTSVDPRDLLSNRLVPLPDPIREAITADAEQTTQTMSRAMSAAALLDHPTAPGPDPARPATTATPPREKPPAPTLQPQTRHAGRPRI